MTCWLAQGRTMSYWPPSTSRAALLENPLHLQEWMMWLWLFFLFNRQPEKRFRGSDAFTFPHLLVVSVFPVFLLLYFLKIFIGSFCLGWPTLSSSDCPFTCWVIFASDFLKVVCFTPLQVSTWTCPFAFRCLSCCTFPCLRARSLSCLSLLCDPTDCSLPSSSLHGIFQARSGMGCHSQPGDQTHISCLRLLHCQADSLPLEPPGKPFLVYSGYDSEMMIDYAADFSDLNSFTSSPLPHISICGRRKCISFAVVHNTPPQI